MGEEIKHRPVTLFASIIFKDPDILENAEHKLRSSFGEFEPYMWSGDFDRTDYYYQEFGRPLFRKILFFKKKIDPSDAPKIKRLTNRMENKGRVDGKRRVNIDPGYITEAKVVLFTTKDYSHRLYMGKGIFAEGTLFFKDKSFHPWPWTYPDYASSELIGCFNKARGLIRPKGY